jgi:K+-transporting ATPase A subunit
MAGAIGANETDAVTFMVSAGLVFEIVAAFCSSPQTAEINADKRANTLMKWVKIGLIEAALFVAIAVLLDKGKWHALLGGSLAGGTMALAYIYAKHAGLNSLESGTES